MSEQAKRFEYAITVARDGLLAAEGKHPLETTERWTPEHLLLAALARCSVASLAYHAKRASLSLEAGAAASGVVTKREQDGRYAFVEVDCRVDVELEPPLSGEDLSALLAKAERDCFVSASLTVPTRYRWRVNGEEVA